MYQSVREGAPLPTSFIAVSGSQGAGGCPPPLRRLGGEAPRSSLFILRARPSRRKDYLRLHGFSTNRRGGARGAGRGVRGPRRAPPSSSPASDAASRRPEPLQEGQTSRNRVFRSEKHPRPTRDHGPVKARFSPHKIKKSRLVSEPA